MHKNKLKLYLELKETYKMTKRSPIAVILLTLVTFGIYGIYWEVKTKGEMNAMGADIPTALLIIVPIANLWWMWKYSQGVEKVTGNKLNGLLVFVGFVAVGFIMMAIVQDSFNNVADAAMPMMAPTPPTPVAPMAPPTQVM